jgi:hypothetical protein
MVVVVVVVVGAVVAGVFEGTALEGLLLEAVAAAAAAAGIYCVHVENTRLENKRRVYVGKKKEDKPQVKFKNKKNKIISKKIHFVFFSTPSLFFFTRQMLYDAQPSLETMPQKPQPID